MQKNLLILGGTTEATTLAQIISKTNINARLSYAGRVSRLRSSPIKKRVGGFGGIPGLVDYLKSEQITHVVDATHPFAVQMSKNAIAACSMASIPLVALTRPPWQKKQGDKWINVPNIEAAVQYLNQPKKRVLLAIGRQNLSLFHAQPHHNYILRLVDPPEEPLKFPNHSIILSKGPFTVKNDLALFKEHKIELVLAKNSGGDGAYSKIEVARILGLPVIMVDRPKIPSRKEIFHADSALSWINQI